MEFKSQICTTVNESLKLLNLGLNPETADMHYKLDGDWVLSIGFDKDFYPKFIIPAWSLHRLLEILSEPYNSYELNIKGLTYDGIIKRIEHNPKVMNNQKVMNLCNG